MTWYDEEECEDPHGCLMLSYVEPVPSNLRSYKLNMGEGVEAANFSKEIRRKSQQHLLEHSFRIKFKDGPDLKLCAATEEEKLSWMKALRAAIDSPESWKAFTRTSRQAEIDEAESTKSAEDDPILQYLKMMRDEKDLPRNDDRELSDSGRMLFCNTVVNFSKSKNKFDLSEMESPSMNPSLPKFSMQGSMIPTSHRSEYIPSKFTAHPYASWESLKGRDSRLARVIEGVLRRTLHGQDYSPPPTTDGTTESFDLMTPEDLGHLAAEVAKIMTSEPSLIRMKAPIKVFGDIHGQISDLLYFFEKYGCPSHIKGDINCINYLFAGDYVDRGGHGLEVLTILMCLKVRYHPHMVLLRGNHEDQSVNARYGFERECFTRLVVRAKGRDDRLLSSTDSKLWKKIYGNIQHVFQMMPLGALIDDKILVVHGGIGQNVWTLSDIEKVKRPLLPLGSPDGSGGPMDLTAKLNPVAIDLLWSDPTDESVGLHPHAMASFNQKRGVGTKFGSAAVENFCKVNGVDMIIRAHECVKDGWKLTCNGRCVTVFSAPNYCGTHRNAGAMLEISGDLHIHCKKILPRLSKGTWSNSVDATPPPSDASSVSSVEDEAWM